MTWRAPADYEVADLSPTVRSCISRKKSRRMFSEVALRMILMTASDTPLHVATLEQGRARVLQGAYKGTIKVILGQHGNNVGIL